MEVETADQCPFCFPSKRLENLSIHVWESLGAPMENVPWLVWLNWLGFLLCLLSVQFPVGSAAWGCGLDPQWLFCSQIDVSLSLSILLSLEIKKKKIKKKKMLPNKAKMLPLTLKKKEVTFLSVCSLSSQSFQSLDLLLNIWKKNSIKLYKIMANWIM